jgi:hypothetical protein
MLQHSIHGFESSWCCLFDSPTWLARATRSKGTWNPYQQVPTLVITLTDKQTCRRTRQHTAPHQCSYHCAACRSVDKNQLTGSIPASWSQLHNLYAVDVTSNEGLCGAVPDGINGVVGFDANYSTTHCPWTDDGECGPAYSSACKLSHGRQQPLPATACMTALLCMACIAGCGTLCSQSLPS